MRRIALAAAVGLIGRAAAAQEGGIAVGSEAPSARVTTLDGKSIDLSTFYDGKPVVIEFWATWCPLCKALEPSMQTARERHPEVHFVGVGVSVNQTADKQRDYVRKAELTGDYVYDGDGAAVKAFSAPHTSYIVIVDRSRRIVYTGVGSDQNIEMALKKIGP